VVIFNLLQISCWMCQWKNF